MAVSDKDYAGSFTIPAPKGVYQAAGDTNISTDYAYKAHNIRTERGLLASSYGIGRGGQGVYLPPLSAQIETLTRFYRRTRPDDPDVFVAAASGRLYVYTMGTEAWIEKGSGYSSDKWSHVTYEAVENDATVDILILSNAKDGMVVIYGSDLRVEKMSLKIGDDGEEVKFAVLGRYAERVWGTGAPGYPDSVFYSKPYDPFDWTGVQENPQMGGGVINQPTWDGDSFMAIEPFGGYLLALKSRTAFEIRGTDPTTFTITQAFGTDGPMEPRTICTDMQRMFFLSQSGIGMYDGATLRLLSRDALYETMRMRMDNSMHLATAAVCDHVYYLALCVREREGDVIAENNTVVEFDTERGTFMVRRGLRVKDFYALGTQLRFTQAEEPYDVLIYNDKAEKGILGMPMESLWQTPWLDLGKAYMKRDFVLRFTAEADDNDVPLELTIITDRREKTKTALLQKKRRDYRVKIQQSGVRMQLRLRSNRAAGWRIFGGIQVEYSLDEV